MKKSLKGTHSSYIDESSLVIDIFEKNGIKYSLGIIKTGIKRSYKYIRLKNKNNNFSIICRGNISIQEIIVYLGEITYDELKKIILENKKIQKKIKKGYKVYMD